MEITKTSLQIERLTTYTQQKQMFNCNQWIFVHNKRWLFVDAMDVKKKLE